MLSNGWEEWKFSPSTLTSLRLMSRLRKRRKAGSRTFTEDVKPCIGLEVSHAAPIFAHATTEGQMIMLADQIRNKGSEI